MIMIDMNWKSEPRKTHKEKKSVNQHLNKIFLDYFKHSSKKELGFDLGLPVIISIILFVIVGLFALSTSDIIKIFTDIISSSLSVLAILAGFNTTCLAVIASTNHETLKKLINKRDNTDADSSILYKIAVFFSYAICSEVVLLIIGIIYIVINKNFQEIYYFIGFINGLTARIIVTVLGGALVATMLHTLFVSLRNVSLLFRFILFIADHKD